MNAGFFCMTDANEIAAMKDLNQAKEYALDKITQFTKQHPSVKPANIVKATSMINEARNINKLVMNIGALVMAHPSEGLKVIR